ncbi:P-loop containing nucleoside triphosphate hydrolases superfamily protein isoform 4, partial [Theobroma cacao]
MGEYEKMMMMNNNKGKGIAVRTRANQNYGGEDEDDGKITSPSVPSAKSSPRNASSKYDFVKIPNHVAIKIALELKKLLIDNSLLDVSQSDLEANLFKLMERRGYGEEYINRYKMMTRFHHQRVPLVILVCGTACVGKSTIATQLAQRLNLPNVLQTDMVYELLRTSTDAPLASTPVWARDFSSSEELITEFCRECRIVRKGLNGDLKKAMKDGKPIIIEGIHLDPSIYLMEDEHKIPISVPEGHQAAPLSKASNDNSAVQMENNSTSTFGSHTEDSQNCPVHLSLDECVSADQVNKVSEYLESIALSTASDDKGETVKVPEVNGTTARKEKSGSEPIIIPIILNMAEFDHKALLEEWILTRTFSGNCPVK